MKNRLVKQFNIGVYPGIIESYQNCYIEFDQENETIIIRNEQNESFKAWKSVYYLYIVY